MWKMCDASHKISWVKMYNILKILIQKKTKMCDASHKQGIRISLTVI